MFVRLKWLVVVAVALVGLSGGIALAQTTQLAVNKDGEVKVVEDKKAPAKVPDVIPIPEARREKVDTLQAKVELASYKLQAIEKQYKEVQAEQQELLGKLQAELASALKGAGLEEKQFDLYKYDQKAFLFSKKSQTEIDADAAKAKKP